MAGGLESASDPLFLFFPSPPPPPSSSPLPPPSISLQSTLLRTVIHFSSPMVPGYVFSFPPSSHRRITPPPLLLSPTRWLRVAAHLRAVCGIASWAGIWQPLIRERMSCALPSEMILILFFSFFFFFNFRIVQGDHLKDLL